MKRPFGLRLTLAAVGGICLVGVAGAAVAAEQGSDDVDVRVEIQELDGPGSLSLTVAGTSAQLVEEQSAGDERVFVGALPTVTVTDTRDPEDIPEGNQGWYVLGSATNFVSSQGQSDIDASNLGWTPALTQGDGSGLVAPGDVVRPSADGGNGFGDDEDGIAAQELLAISTVPTQDLEDRSWSANAELRLVTGRDVAPGSYASTMTLSLFE